MIKSILITVIFLLAISGLAELIHTIKLAIIAPKKRFNTFSVAYLKKGDAVSQIRHMSEQTKWFGKLYADHLIAITNEITDDELENCKEVAKRENVILCPMEALYNVVSFLGNTN